MDKYSGAAVEQNHLPDLGTKVAKRDQGQETDDQILIQNQKNLELLN